MNSSENWLIGKLATNPRLIHSVPVKPEWFGETAVQELVRLMVKLDGDWLGEMDLSRKLELENKTAARHIDWLTIDQTQAFHYPLTQVVATLEKQYTMRQAQAAAMAYYQQPSERNTAALLKTLQQVGVEQNTVHGAQLADLGHQYLNELDNPQEDDGVIKTIPVINGILGGGLAGGQLIIIGARPSTGKSAFALNMIDGVEHNSTNMVTDLYSLEMTAKENRNRFISLTARVPLGAIKNYRLASDQRTKVEAAAGKFEASNIEIFDNARTLGQITESIRERAASATKGHYIAFVDYLGLVEPDHPTGNRYQDVSHITRAFKVLANELDIPIVLLSQLNRENARNKRAPEMFDLRDSGSIEQDANVVIFLYQEDEDGADDAHRDVTVKVAKNRDGERRSLQFEFIPSLMLFREAR
ncbi:DnaB-like helicase C-terminal domain-containing protein [Schleiferilactobacillus harbinensis]|uniref:DnaB-like helicase C-terminal domain-containing protein n=1 Tax=Schleiferilactobacillus harbinensis TaxID=304207 RepID=A0ABU7T315_9LACO